MGGGLEILPGHVVYPINWSDNVHNKFRHKLKYEKRLLSIEEARELFPSSLAVTYWAHSWGEVGEHPKDSTIINRIPSMVKGLINTLKP